MRKLTYIISSLLFLFTQTSALAAAPEVTNPGADALEKGMIDPKLARVLVLMDDIVALSIELGKAEKLPSAQMQVLDAKDGWIRAAQLEKEATAEFKIARAENIRKNKERLNQAQALLPQWAQLASQLDTESHNLLVFHLIYGHFENQFSEVYKSFLTALNKSTASQVQEQKNNNSLIHNSMSATVLYPFYIFSSGRLAYGAYGFSKKYVDAFKKIPARVRAGTNAWEWMLYMRAFVRKSSTKAGLPMVIAQPEPSRPIAGFLEYKGTPWQQFVRRNLWPPNTLSKQLLASLIAGATVATMEYSWNQLTEKKLAPLELLRLAYIQQACELSFITSKAIEACGEKEDKCDSQPGKKLAIASMIGSSMLLLRSFSEGENLSLADLKETQGQLLLQIPDKYRPLFGTLFNKDMSTVEPLCQRIALSPQNVSWQLEQQGIDLQRITKPRTIDEEP